jgi:hypothetical protein
MSRFNKYLYTYKSDIIGILIGLLLFIVSVGSIVTKEDFNFETDFISIAFAISSSMVITLLLIILFHIVGLKRDFELKRKLLMDKRLSEWIDLFVDSYVTVRDNKDKLFNDRLNEVIDEFKITISDLKNGYIVFDETDKWQNFFLNILKSLKENDTFKATNLVYINWWNTAFGRQIREENKKALADRNVKTTRLFFKDEDDINTWNVLVEEIGRQKKADVDVRVLNTADLYPYQIEDFIIAGENYTARLELRKGRLRKVHIYNTKVEIARANRLFKELEIKSKSLEEFEESKESLSGTAQNSKEKRVL